MTRALWQPDADRIAAARITSFADSVSVPRDYAALWDWSVREPAAFWSAVWDFCDILGDRGQTALLEPHRMPGARWFPEARLSFAENLLARRDDSPAIVFRREDGHRREIGFAELADLVSATRSALRNAGIRTGDRVAALLPNVPEAVIAMLATSSLGATWSSCSPDFGTAGVLDRFAQIEPRLLLWPDAYLFKGKRYPQLDRLVTVLSSLPTVDHTIVVPCVDDSPSQPQGTTLWNDFLSAPPDPRHDRLPFDHPLFIMYSSGTTGKPKCILHGAGGTLLQHAKEHRLHTDLGPDDRLFYFTTTGWMMWNWLVSALAAGTTIVLFDGHPFHPSPYALWQMAEEEGVTVFGTSAKYLAACAGQQLAPGRTHGLDTVRCVLSTGSPLLPETSEWVYGSVKADIQLSSISGGTDIVSCFALGCPTLPVHPGELQCRGLGMKVEVFDPDGRSIVDRPGELVCSAPFPSMPLGFLHDPGNERYRQAYFERYPGTWHHGDWAELTSRGSLIITGRSDTTLNPGGVRIGTAEIYRQVEQLDEVEEAIVVGQEWEGDQRIVLFLRLQEGLELDDSLRQRLRDRLRRELTPRHVPAVIAQVSDIPRTRNGKLSEIAVRETIHGRAIPNTESLANPESLEQFKSVIEQRGKDRQI